MASRRSRIKAIASIPQRRKPNEEENIKLQEVENDNSHSDTISEKTNLLKEENDFESSVNNKTEESHDKINLNIESSPVTVKKSSEDLLNKTTDNKDSTAANNIVCQTKPIRRKFIKPLVNIIQKKTKICTENLQEILPSTSSHDIPQLGTDSNKVNNLKTLKNEIGNNSLHNVQLKAEAVNIKNEAEITLNEINLTTTAPSELVLEPNTVSEANVNFANNSNMTTTQVELDYPPPPPSPSITSRVRIKAIPKLRYRKTSFSASESEDDTRKFNRIRNDSVCSSTSVNTESPLDSNNTQKPREINTIIQKKCNRTEQTRKLAEARREFQRRFGSNAPDRQKLTMMDLIFYNPDTNPMEKQSPKDTEENIINEKVDEEAVDDPSNNTVEIDKSDEENDVPVPQIKIGPSGEIILDEKSLVVERKDIKRQREQIAKSQIVNGDFDTGYGIYKKHKRSKFWTTDETLRFYKALNTLGTDFTLMCELFPDRTRRELKMKFNKEEKINRTLIDKALMQPCGFDYYVLKEEVELEQREKAELEKLKLEESKKKEEKKDKEFQKKKRIMKDELEQKVTVESDQQKLEDNIKKEEKKEKETQKRKKRIEETELNSNAENRNKEIKHLKKSSIKRMKRKRLDINAILEDTEDADESDIDTNSEDEVISSHKPTRSGRMPKVPRKFDVSDEMVVEKIVKKSKDEIEPGSIMIVTEEGPTGEPVYKIFMITQGQEKTQLELNSDEDVSGIQLTKGITAKNILTISAIHTDDEEIEEDIPQPLENNITIPADENVTTLKTYPYPNQSENLAGYDRHISEQDEVIHEEEKKTLNKSFQVPDEEMEEVNYHHSKEEMTYLPTNATFMRRDSTVSFDEPLPEENNITISEDATITSLRPKPLISSLETTDSCSVKTDQCLEAINIKMELSNTNEKSSNFVIFNDFSANDEKIDVD